MALPTVMVTVAGSGLVRALVDTGCSQTIAAKHLVKTVSRCSGGVIAVNGAEMKCSEGQLVVHLEGSRMSLRCLVLEKLLSQYDLILGMDVVRQLGGVRLTGTKVAFGLVAQSDSEARQEAQKSGGTRQEAPVGSGARQVVQIGSRNCRKVQPKGEACGDGAMAPITIDMSDVDFSANFDGQKWTVAWKWTNGEASLRNRVVCYKVPADHLEAFDKEVEAWIEEGILQPVPQDEPVTSVLPLMAVVQPKRRKVRPVPDFRQLNAHVSSHSGGSDVCADTLRKWRQVGENVALLDLRKAYLQLHVDRSLWKHQVVQYKGAFYHLTRLGFGLNCAPKIMSCILDRVLTMNPNVRAATDSYIDDILVNEDLMSAEDVAMHLARYGLQTKSPERIANGAKVLGLHARPSPRDGVVWSQFAKKR